MNDIIMPKETSKSGSSKSRANVVAEIWKDNLLEELEQETQEFSTAEELYEKIRKEFGKIN